MKSIFSKILLLQRQDYLLIFKRKLFWILIPGLLAGLLAITIVPDSRVPNHLVPNGPNSEIIQPASETVSRKVKIEDSQPNQRFVVLAILVGFVVGVGLALFLELKDGSARSESELARFTGIPVLASIPIIQDHESALPKDRREP
jgi:hypothetical protein